jgi:hypothetical protein
VATPKYADDTADLEEKLCYLSGMVATPHLTEPWPARKVLDLTLLEDDKPALTNMRLLDYFRTVHKQLWNLRHASPGFSTCYLDAVTLDDDPKTNGTLLLERYGGVVQPLVQVGRLSRAEYVMLPAPGLENVKSMVAVKSAYEFLLSDIFGGIGPLSLSSYPGELQEKAAIRESLLVSYADWLGKDTGLEIATS